jgi:DNA-binding NarL/FixJ family response regulator
MEKTTCMIIDDEIEAIDCLERLLLKIDTIQILSSITQTKDIIPEIISKKPDILFLDVEISDKTGFEILDELKKERINTAVVFVTAYDQYAIKAIKKKAFDYLLKPVDIDDLKFCIERFISEKTNGHLKNLDNCILCRDFSKRENEIVDLIFKGYTSKNIAERLFLSKHTIDFHRKNILHKTGCKNFAELRHRFSFV